MTDFQLEQSLLLALYVNFEQNHPAPAAKSTSQDWQDWERERFTSIIKKREELLGKGKKVIEDFINQYKVSKSSSPEI